MEHIKLFDSTLCKKLAEIHLGIPIEDISFGEDFFCIKISYKKLPGSSSYVHKPPKTLTTVFDIVFVKDMLKTYEKQEHIKITKHEVLNKLLRGTIFLKQ